ncbi:MAG: serine protease [Pseudomonadota bacterium]
MLAALLALSLLLTSAIAQEDAPATARAVPPVERWLDSVVLLVTGPAWCSGVVVDAEGTVATAYHCVANGRRPQVRLRDGRRFVGRVTALSHRDDLALLSVPALAGAVPPLVVRAAPALRGEAVWALGHPYAPQEEGSPLLAGTLLWSAAHGVVSGIGERLVQVDAALNPGNSGGPVVDAEGAILGIASRRLQADNIAFITPASGLIALQREPRRPLLGGTWGLSLVGVQGLEVADVPSIGLQGEVGLRDRVLAQGALYLPMGQRWTALGLGEAHWVTASFGACLRARIGRGRWSTALDLGGAGLLLQAIDGQVEDGRVEIWSRPAVLRPAAAAGLGLAGSTVRLAVVPVDGAIQLLIGVELGFPGVLGTF